MSETPVLHLMQQIKDRKVDPQTITTDDRRRCVELLQLEGYQVPEMAQILKRNERTIRRDLAQIREEHSVNRDPALVEQCVGDLLRRADSASTHLNRIARNKSASAMEQLLAEQGAWKVRKDLIELLQSLGYLPRVPTGVVAEVHQHIAVQQVPAYEELQLRIERLQTIGAARTGEAVLDQIKDEVQRGLLAAQIDHVTTQADRDLK